MEGEALLLGNWKNIQDLEQSLCLAELELIVEAARNREEKRMEFQAALKGINLGESAKDKVEEMKKKAAAKNESGDETKTEKQEFAEFGIEFE